MNKLIEISQENLQKLYRLIIDSNISRDLIGNTMKAIFGEDILNPKPIMSRIKIFEDAYNELGESHPYIMEYNHIKLFSSNVTRDLIAYTKLRIITFALNEG